MIDDFHLATMTLLLQIIVTKPCRSFFTFSTSLVYTSTFLFTYLFSSDVLVGLDFRGKIFYPTLCKEKEGVLTAEEKLDNAAKWTNGVHSTSIFWRQLSTQCFL